MPHVVGYIMLHATCIVCMLCVVGWLQAAMSLWVMDLSLFTKSILNNPGGGKNGY